ncbi:MAG: 4-hydroxyphenylpyruvate dioxygenase [Polyangiaceae bacterium]|nr:4-hydroxyphenylpyruvate dioxygenase [Polyangiaceae bacterium]
MPKLESLGIRRIESIHYYVRDIERSRKFYCDMMDFAEIGESGADLDANGKQHSVLFRAGDCNVVCSQPVGEGGRAWRYLKKHPDGIGTLTFEVADILKTFRLLDERGGTPIDDIQEFTDEKGGKLSTFSITTPFGDTTFRFVQRNGFGPLFPGLVDHAQPRGGKNVFGIEAFDHVTSNFQTMKPALLWMEHVMGFETYWNVQFHTEDVNQDHSKGSGLRSTVMWEPGSGVKFANNEPWRPFFKASQINIFNEEHRGDGVQHVALTVKDILSSVRGMRERGVSFMPTPGTYYDMLPARLQQIGVQRIEEETSVLRDLGILVDGEKEKQYLLQIFLKDSAGLYGQPEAGPFFYEIIQRKGDRGFGAGNFRALFESIERQQEAEGKI